VNRTSAKHTCGERLWMGTHDGRLIEACPACHWGWPRTVLPKYRRVCESCGRNIDGEHEQWTRCQPCRAKQGQKNACVDCGAPCVRERCVACRHKLDKARRVAEQRNRRLREYTIQYHQRKAEAIKAGKPIPGKPGRKPMSAPFYGGKRGAA
jgi:hypothetical protein